MKMPTLESEANPLVIVQGIKFISCEGYTFFTTKTFFHPLSSYYLIKIYIFAFLLRLSLNKRNNHLYFKTTYLKIFN